MEQRNRAKADAQVEPKDHVPNAVQMDKTTQRILSFFNTNLKIVQVVITKMNGFLIMKVALSLT